MNLPYGFYNFLRIVVFIFFLIAATISYEKKSKYLPWLFCLIAILYNPLLKIHLSKEVWMYANLLTAFVIYITSKKIRND